MADKFHPQYVESLLTVICHMIQVLIKNTVLGALVMMAGITIANMRKGVLLHKLILLEVRNGQQHL